MPSAAATAGATYRAGWARPPSVGSSSLASPIVENSIVKPGLPSRLQRTRPPEEANLMAPKYLNGPAITAKLPSAATPLRTMAH